MDSDFFGDEAVVATPLPKRRKVGKQRPARSEAPDSGDGASDDGSQSCCHLCCEPLAGQPSWTHCGRTFHNKGCWAAIRCYRRLMDGDTNKIRRFNDLMIQDPQRWRRDLLPLVKKPGQTRNPAARAEAKKKLTITDNYTKEEYIKRGFVLNLHRFKKYMNEWDGMDESDAEEEFSRLLQEQGSAYSDGFEDKVLAPGNDEVVKIKGSGIHKQEVATVEPPSSCASSSAPPRLVDSRMLSDARTLQVSPEFKRHRSASPSAMGSGDSDDAANSDTGDGSTSKHRMTSRSFASAPQRMSNARSASGSSPNASMAAGYSSRGSRDSARPMSPVEFMQAKSDLKKLVSKHTSLEKSRKYVVHRIEASVAKLSPDQAAQLPSDPSHVKSTVVAKMNSLQSLAQGIDKVKVEAWGQLKNSVADAIDSLETQCAEAEAEWKAIDFLVQQKAAIKKAERSSDRYKKDRIVTKLTNNNWGTNIAKKLVQWIEGASSHSHGPISPHMNAGEVFDKQVLNLWLADGSEKNSFKASLMNDFSDIINAKRDGLCKFMSESATLCGGQTKLDIGSQSFKHLLCATDSEKMMGIAGTEPWIMNGRPWAARCGPSAFPLPGFGCWVQAHNDNVTHMLILIQAHSVLEQGISLSDIMSFLDTPTGLDMFTDSSYTVAIGPNEMVWIPYGYIPIPLVTEPLDDDKPVAIQEQTKQAKFERDAKSTGTYTVLTVFSDSLAALVDATTWLAILKFNLDYCKKNAHRATWSGRCNVLASFAESVAKLRST